ncbi:hypothetical protein GC177_01725 [bacterium]|nr:hypothetical protein [bacterium]
MLEYFSASFLYSALKDFLKNTKISERLIGSSPLEILDKRNKWQAEITEKLREFRKRKLGCDVIIHDLKRLDEYPDSSNRGKKISPWFRAGLMDTYHRGILLGLSWVSLIHDPVTQTWRYASSNEEGKVFCLAGKVPYENIASINWDGDDYYGMPHIYCHFNRSKGQPYEDIVICEGIEITHVPDMPVYKHYSEVVSEKDVIKLKKGKSANFFQARRSHNKQT